MAVPTPQVNMVQRIRAFDEPTFGADSSGSSGSFVDLPIIEGTAAMVTTEDELDPGQLVQRRVQGREKVLGKRSATLSFQLNIAPTGTAAVNGVSSVTSPLGMVLKAVMGGEQLGEGSVAAAGSTAIVVNVSTGDGAQWANPGQAMGWTNAAGIVEWQEVESRSTDAITLKHGFSGVPQTSDVLYNAATYYYTASPSQSLAFIVNGIGTEDTWLLTGGQCVGGMTIAVDLTGGAIPRATFSMTFANWFTYSEMASPPTIGTATYTATNPIVGEAGLFELQTVASPTYSTAQAVYCSAITWEPQISFVPITAPNGTNTVVRWVATKPADGAIKGSWTEIYDNDGRWTQRDAKGDYCTKYTMGVAGGSAVILSAPTVQLLNPQRVADANALAAATIMWSGRMDEDVGSATSDIAKSPFRIHLG